MLTQQETSCLILSQKELVNQDNDTNVDSDDEIDSDKDIDNNREDPMRTAMMLKTIVAKVMRSSTKCGSRVVLPVVACRLHQ